MAIDHLSYQVHACSIPFEGETLSGDMSYVRPLESGSRIFIAVIDVAGHGEQAAKLAKTINTYLSECDPAAGLEHVVTGLHKHIHGTRGCAGGFCLLNFDTNSMQYLGVGNTKAMIFGNRTKRFVGKTGILGYIIPKFKIETDSLEKGEFLILYTDGVKEYFDLKKLDITKSKSVLSAKELADKIVEVFGKTNDDSICLVLKRMHTN